ncbi:DHA2 family efflux MFS transporter permease subunit [Kaistia geumhonensis]|uniref:DHA2 family multidrug resistance protein n=1 Tax=Kaistia geumhonensis TaxID=410839 RepID=A0ABU0M8Z5_9HYPH|nr:DHA2 family efflux MFS transporter permease subunit [Kaistia geumhonensis]MCX5480860.1 DHA2 family efflux MFS transporter permease subunit [Kaistia geumhonensis]MDQ0517436.1 DHA2 family multidrug resistance protein [Kaistia geumhonensis]
MSTTSADTVPFRGLITVSIMLATIMQVLDTTIANVALPSMQGSLGAAQDTITWVLTSYIVAAAIATPVTGWVADRIGIKRLFLTCIVGFTLASMLCGLAGSLYQMVGFRILQGIFGAALVPLSQSVLLSINPKERHGQAMAMWGAGIMVGPIIGPTLGGWLTDSFNWRWVFFINLPVGIVAFLGIFFFMREGPIRLRKFDFFGFAFLSLGIGALQMMLDRGEQLDWFSSTEILIETGLMVIGFWVFVVHMATSRETFIDPHIFKDRNFVTGLVFIFIIGIILLATMALLPPMLQNLYGYPVITTGLILAPRGVGTMIAMMLVGRLVGRVDPRILIFIGLSLTTWSLYEMTTWSEQMGAMPFMITGITQGFGLGFVFVPLSTISFATLPPKWRTDAASLFSLVRNLGSSIGVSIVATLLAQNTQIMHQAMAGHVTATNPALPMDMAMGDLGALAQLNGFITREAAFIAYIDDFKLMMFVTMTTIPLLLLLRNKPQKGPAEHVALD